MRDRGLCELCGLRMKALFEISKLVTEADRFFKIKG